MKNEIKPDQPNHTKKRKAPLPLMLAGVGLIFIAGAFILFKVGLQSEKVYSIPAYDETGVADSVIPAVVEIEAPELTLTTVDGKAVSLLDYRDQVVLVNNWATWCPPCRAEMPELEAYYQNHKNNGFVLIGISAGDPLDQVQAFISEYGLSFPIWLDPTMMALDAFNSHNLPSSFVIDPTGTIRLAWTGAISLDMLEKYVTPLLEN
ncbi:MAG: TlpA family protein disulfide reductase [Anaerolineae bacterium]|nr:TlpA family protein disulfide reductase [Anaerolineae bacterium]